MPETQSNAPAASNGGRMGRPRATGGPSQGDVAAEILKASARLFLLKGYEATSTREIAAAVGLRQGSLSYYFPRKQNILEALLRQMVQETLDMIDSVIAESGSAAEQLAKVVYADVLALCQPGCIGALAFMPEVRSDDCADKWSDYHNIRNVYRRLIQQAANDGDFAADNIDFATQTVVGIVESAPLWYQPSQEVSPEDCAERITRMLLGDLVDDPDTVKVLLASAVR